MKVGFLHINHKKYKYKILIIIKLLMYGYQILIMDFLSKYIVAILG